MRRFDTDIASSIDWITILIYVVLVIFGWLNIYASTYQGTITPPIFSLDIEGGKQLVFIAVSIIAVVAILILDFRFYDYSAYAVYVLGILSLLLVLAIAEPINGARSWIQIGGMTLQPSEFAKVATSLAFAKVLSSDNFKFKSWINIVKTFAVFIVPMALVLLQKDAGTTLVYLAFFLVMFREGFSPIPFILAIAFGVLFILSLIMDTLFIYAGLATLAFVFILFVRKRTSLIISALGVLLLFMGFVYSVGYVMDNVLKPYQKQRIQIVFNPNSDPRDAGYNILQAKIALGSGGIKGKGYLNGTQTNGGFVPAQSTDFIFCTVGEEHGFIGSALVIILFAFLIIRVINLAERQKWKFARVYGYCVASIFFIHFVINIGMTIGLVPVIGIPLPFFSYGGSSLLSFTILLFVFLKLDAHRSQMLDR